MKAHLQPEPLLFPSPFHNRTVPTSHDTPHTATSDRHNEARRKFLDARKEKRAHHQLPRETKGDDTNEKTPRTSTVL